VTFGLKLLTAGMGLVRVVVTDSVCASISWTTETHSGTAAECGLIRSIGGLLHFTVVV